MTRLRLLILGSIAWSATCIGQPDYGPLAPSPVGDALCCYLGSCCPPQSGLLEVPRLSQLGGGFSIIDESSLESLPISNLSVASGPSVANAEAPDSICKPVEFRPFFNVKRDITYYSLTENYERCHTSAKELVNFRTSEEGLYSIWPKEKLGNTTLAEEYLTLISEYRNACLSISEQNPELSGLYDDLKEKLASNVGFFFAEGIGLPFCAGVEIGSHIITARHCFAGVSVPEALPNPTPVVVSENVRFQRFSANSESKKVQLPEDLSDQAMFFPREPSKDWFILELLDNSIDSKNEIDISSPSQFDDVILMAFDANRLLSEILSKNLSSTDGLDDIVYEPSSYIDFSPLCRVALLSEDNLFWHSCQSEAGTSGAPLLRISGSQFELVGIQAGRSNHIKSSCTERYVEHFPNYAVVLSKKVRDYFSK